MSEPQAFDLPTRPRPAWMQSRSAKVIFALLLGLIFVTGLAIRLYRLSAPPLDFHPTRQLHSALIARGMYDQYNASVPDWQRRAAVDQWHMEGLIEPQVFERMVSWTYSLLGRVDLRVPRLYAVLFWMAAAVFLAWIALDLMGWGGALVASLFFLIWPYGVVASRAFMPEPLMLALMVAALWAGLRWHSRGGWGWALAAGLLAGLSIYIKSVAAFFVVPALAALILNRRGLRRAVRDPQTWALAALSVIPYGLYVLDGVVLHTYLVGQFSLRFFPEMWPDPAFYLRWISNLGRAVPFEMALVALAGGCLVRRSEGRWMLLAMWVGYFAYGMTLSHHISTHDYYHLPLFPVVALGLGAVGQTIFEAFRGPAWFNRLAAAALLAAALVIDGYGARTTLKRSDMTEQAADWETIGQTLHPGASVVALVDDYGSALRYYAWINPIVWPTTSDIEFRQSVGQGGQDFSQMFDSQAAGRDFFVISPLSELDTQPDLARMLASRYTLLREGADYRIYDLRVPKTKP